MIYRQRRNLCNTAVRNAKRNFLFKGTLKPTATLWKYLKFRFESSAARRINMPWSADSASAAKSSANKIKSYFINNVTAINSNFVLPQSNPSSPLLPCVSSFSFSPVRETDVSKALASMASTNSSGTDSITLHELRMSTPEILPALPYIFNLSISLKTFPFQWKHARITPIYKKSDVHDVVNYRPKFILTILLKLFEKIIDEQVRSYLNSEHLISTN